MLGVAKDPLQHTSMYERLEEESEDSDGEGGLGNVSRVIIRPPGVSGKAKRGHLCFDAAYETGNLGKAELAGEFEYDLYLRPDTCNPRFRFWFNFTVDNVKQDQRVIFNVINFSKWRNLFNAGLVPLVKSSSRPKWQRLPRKNVFYYRSPFHQNHYVLSFAFTFDKEDEVYQFSVAPPYSYSRLQSYLSFIENRQQQHDRKFLRTQLTKSVQNRKIDLITINQVTNRGQAMRSERNFIRVIVVLSRVHASASPASYVCQGFLEFLLSNHSIAKVLREHFVFKIVPMVNPDGVFLGNNRCNLIGQDLNRMWHLANEFLHPEIYAIKNMLKDIDNSDIYQIDFVIDLHANNSSHGCFIYGNTYEDVYRYERHLVFPRLFNANAPDYAANNMMFNTDEKKVGSTRRYCCERLSDTVNAYTLEISIGGHYLKDGKTVTLYTEEAYYRCGRNLARTFLQYYRFINILPVPMATEIKTKKRRPRTHQARTRSRLRYEVKPRPKTTRCYAPISYTNLSITYESGGSSDEGAASSPTRYRLAPGSSHFSGCRNYRKIISSAVATTQAQDQLTLLRIKSGKYVSLNYNYVTSGTLRQERPLVTQSDLDKKHTQFDATFNVPPKPYLSIIDLNQLTRGSLNRKSASFES